MGYVGGGIDVWGFHSWHAHIKGTRTTLCGASILNMEYKKDVTLGDVECRRCLKALEKRGKLKGRGGH